jgi:hypothetical protein
LGLQVLYGLKKEKKFMKGDKELYSEIETLVTVWGNDGTKTAGSLTRQIMELLERRDTANEIKSVLEKIEVLTKNSSNGEIFRIHEMVKGII